MDDLDIAKLPILITLARRAGKRRRTALVAAAVGALVLAVAAGIDLLPVPLASAATVTWTLLIGGYTAA
jgi:hypothetical protein